MNTAYTHQWREPWAQGKRRMAMASVETLAQARVAWAKGWRTFRTILVGEEPSEDEIVCPNVTHAVQCADCGLCSGAGPQKNIVVPIHGGPSKVRAMALTIGEG